MAVKRCAWKWKSDPGMPGIQAPLSFGGDFVISHRPQNFTVSYRPPGEHHHVGSFGTLRQAKAAARRACQTGDTGRQIAPFRGRR